MMIDFKPGQLVTIQGDKRWEEPTQAVVVGPAPPPLAEVRLGTNQYNTKARAFFVNASKLVV